MCSQQKHSKQRKRPIESRQSGNVRKAARKACETGEETRKRQAQNQEHMASLRQSETREQSMKRQAQNQERMASLRQSDTCEQSMKRQAQNQECMASLRLHCSVSIATHQIAEWRTCANQLTPRVLHFSALVVCSRKLSRVFAVLPPSAKGFSVNSEKGQLGYTLIFPQKSMFLQNVTFLPIH